MNTKWMLQTYTTVLVSQLNGTSQMINPAINEIKDLIDRGYLVAAPEMGQQGENVVVRAVENPANTVANLATQLGLTINDAAEALAPHGKDVNYAPFAQQAVAAPSPAPIVSPVAPAPVAETAAVAPSFQPQVTEQAAQAHAQPVPTFNAGYAAPEAQVQETAVPAVAPAYKSNEAVQLGLNQQHQVVTKAETKAGEFEIEVGVPFIKKAQGFVAGQTPRRNVNTTPKYPFDAIAEAKIQYGITSDAFPSFHLASTPEKEMLVKNVSGDVKRASDLWEAKPIAGTEDRITFRALAVDETDPQGAGVRIYAMALSQAPARRTAKKKKGGDVA